MKNFIEEVTWRGMLHDVMPGTEEHLMEALGLMSDMLKNPLFDINELEKLKTQDLAGIEQNKSDPQFLAIREMGLINQKYEKGHPLYNMTIDEEIQAIISKANCQSIMI